MRVLQRLRALTGGYFWLPCPICGEMFGGHEKHGILMTSCEGGQLTCIKCAPEAARRTKQLYVDSGLEPKIILIT